MTNSNDQVKDLLGRALGQEPPLRIDRDEVIQQGRKRLRRRRVFEAGSVVAAVLVVALGAATLTNLAGSEPDRLPPAAGSSTSSTGQAPDGPVLPLPGSPPTSVPTTKSPSSVAPPPLFPGKDQLTDLVYSSGIVTRGDVGLVGDPPHAPGFHLAGATYTFEADVFRQQQQGYLQVTVDFTPDTAGGCDAIPAGFGSCTVKSSADNLVTISEWQGRDGERRLLAVTVLADGTRVASLASNISIQARKKGQQPNGTVPPVLSDDELCVLVTKVAIRAR